MPLPRGLGADDTPGKSAAHARRGGAAGGRAEFRPNSAAAEEVDRGHGVMQLLESQESPFAPGGGHTMTSMTSLATSSCLNFMEGSASCMNSQMSDAESSLGFGMHHAGELAVRPAIMPSIPECFKCPFSHHIMEDPVCLDDGRTCDRSSVPSLGYEGVIRSNSVLKMAMEGYFELLDDMERRHNGWATIAKHHEQKLTRKLEQRKRQAQVLKEEVMRTQRRAHSLARTNMRKASQLSELSGGSTESTATGSSEGSVPSAPGSERKAQQRQPEDGQSLERRQEEQRQQPMEETLSGFKTGVAPRSAKASLASRPPMRSPWARLWSGRLVGAGGA